MLGIPQTVVGVRRYCRLLHSGSEGNTNRSDDDVKARLGNICSLACDSDQLLGKL